MKTIIYHHPVLLDLFILLPINLQTTFVYDAHNSKFLGFFNQHKQTIKWLKSEEALFDKFEILSGDLPESCSCTGFTVDFEENLGTTRLILTISSNKYDFI